MLNIVYPNGRAEITIPATESIAVWTSGEATVSRELGYPNVPATISVLGVVDNEETVFGAYATGATIIIEAGAAQVLYEVGAAPRVQAILASQNQGDPNALNATGTLTAAMILGGIVTSTTAAAPVVATLDTGAVMDAASEFAIGDSIDWSVINTGAANAFTVTAAASGHTVVGSGTVALTSSGHFRTRKTAADTFITYRIG